MSDDYRINKEYLPGVCQSCEYQYTGSTCVLSDVDVHDIEPDDITAKVEETCHHAWNKQLDGLLEDLRADNERLRKQDESISVQGTPEHARGGGS